MGVIYLKTFAEMVGAVKKVNILDDINRYRVKTKAKPVIVVDGINLMMSFVKNNKLSWLAGGDLHIYIDLLTDFLQVFKLNDVDLVVFMDGPNWMLNEKIWIRRKQESVNRWHHVFNLINKGDLVNEVETNCNYSPVLPGAWAETLYILKEFGFKVINSVHHCDYEMAAYALENDCVAIFANDTDFVINSNCEVYRTDGMDLLNMSFLRYDRDKLLSILNIKAEFLPLFASLVGNDFLIPYRSMNWFHQRYSKSKEKDICKLFFNVSKYINTLVRNFSEKTLEKVALDVFQDVGLASLIKKSLEFYNVSSFSEIIKYHQERFSCEDEQWSNILEKVYNEHVNSAGTTFFFSVICLKTFQHSNLCEDFRELDIPPIQKVLQPLRKKLYGILLKECPGGKKVEEMTVKSPVDFNPENIEGTPPRAYHPGLLVLWSKRCKNIKFKLLGDIFDVEYIKIRTIFSTIPDNLIVPALSLKYLVKMSLIFDWEVRAVILSAIIVYYMSSSEISSIAVNKISSRPTRLFSLITSTYRLTMLALTTLGNLVSYEEILPRNYQSGNIFHIIYKMLNFGDSSLVILERGFGVVIKENIKTCQELEDTIMSFIYESSAF